MIVPPKPQESPETAAVDFAEVRFRINQKARLISDAEVSRRHIQTAVGAAITVVVAIVVVLYVLRVPQGSPLRLPLGILGLIDLVALLAVGVALAFGYRSLMKKRKEIGDLRLEVAQLREGERDARSRIPAGREVRLLWTYHLDVMNTIEEYRDGARKYRRIHNRFQTVIIIGSLGTTAISTAAVRYGNVDWVAVGVSFAVGISAGMTGYFKFRERSMNLQQAADDLEQEHKAVELGIRAYRKLPDDERLVEFAERAEQIKDQQRKREQQLEQPPEGRSGPTGTASAEG